MANATYVLPVNAINTTILANSSAINYQPSLANTTRCQDPGGDQPTLCVGGWNLLGRQNISETSTPLNDYSITIGCSTNYSGNAEAILRFNGTGLVIASVIGNLDYTFSDQPPLSANVSFTLDGQQSTASTVPDPSYDGEPYFANFTSFDGGELDPTVEHTIQINVLPPPTSAPACFTLLYFEVISLPQQTSSNDAGKIAGGVVGGVVGAALLVFFYWFFIVRKRRAAQRRGDIDTEPEMSEAPASARNITPYTPTSYSSPSASAGPGSVVSSSRVGGFSTAGSVLGESSASSDPFAGSAQPSASALSSNPFASSSSGSAASDAPVLPPILQDSRGLGDAKGFMPDPAIQRPLDEKKTLAERHAADELRVTNGTTAEEEALPPVYEK